MPNMTTINRYIDNASFLTKVNPLIKLVLIITIIITMSIKVSLPLYLIFFIYTLFLEGLSKINLVYFHRQLLFVWLFLIFFIVLGIINNAPLLYYPLLILRFYTTFHLLLLFGLSTDINVFIAQLSVILKPFLSTKVRANLMMNIYLIYSIVPLLLMTINDIYRAQRLRRIKPLPKNIPLYLIALILQIDPMATNLYEGFHSRRLTASTFIDDQTKFTISKYDYIFILMLIIMISIGIYR